MPRSWSATGWVACLALASVALVASVNSVSYLPTNDGPQIILAAFMENHYSDPGSVFPEQVEPTLQFTHRGFSFLFLPLEAVFGWRAALRVSLSVIALTTAWGFAALVAVLAPARRGLGLLGFAVALGWHLYMGFFSFEWATGIGLLIVAYAMTPKSQSTGGRVLLAAALGIQAVCHVFGAVLTGVVLILVETFRSARTVRVKNLGVLAVVGLPAMMVLAASILVYGDLTSTPFSSGFVTVGVYDRMLEYPQIVCPGPVTRAMILVAVVVVSLALAIVRWKLLSSNERALAVASFLMLGVGALSPMHVPGWQFFSPRFLPVGALLGLALVPVEKLRLPALKGASTAAIVGATIASLVISASLHRRIYSSCANELSGLDRPLRRLSFQLPILLDRGSGPVLDREIPYMDPVLHLGALYAVQHGGSIPYLFRGSSAAYAFRPRTSPRRALPIPKIERYWAVLGSDVFQNDPIFRRGIVTELAAHGMAYEAIVAMRARPEDIDELRSRGYVEEWSVGSLFVGRFSPCSRTVVLRGLQEAAKLEWGMDPLEQSVQQIAVPAPRNGADAVEVTLDRIACGDVWFRIRGQASAATDTCAEAGADGKLHARLMQGITAPLQCTLEGAP